MARRPVNIERQQTWGVLRYNTTRHSFKYTEVRPKRPKQCEPYPDFPVVLNIVVTRHCNMNCDYCVAQDFSGLESDNLVVSDEMLRWIDQSHFMLLVLTGGEPLLPPYDKVSMRLIDYVRDRGIVLDTNGTILPNHSTLSRLKRNRVMVRVSLDSVRPEDETGIRHVKKGSGFNDKSAYFAKLENIEHLISAGVTTAIQTVVWRANTKPLFQMIDWLSSNGIKRWYLQRLIPSYKFKYPSPRKAMKPEKYYTVVADLVKKARSEGIECVAKMDLRHNSVFLLTAGGALYSQGQLPGQKIYLGTTQDDIQYFDYVSQADHACRYYLAERPREVCEKEERNRRS